MRLKGILCACLVAAAVMAAPAWAQEPAPGDQQQPNILLIVADDLGWSDPGFLGSRIMTPNIDALAQRGTFMADFYVAPTCSPTRAMLLTGVSNHAAGVGSMNNLQTPNQVGQPGYEAQLHDGVVTVAEALQARGYRTMMAGKWHLALDASQYPHRRGFHRSYGLLQGASSHFADQQLIAPTEEVDYLEDGQPVDLPPDFYSSTNYTDKIIDYIDEAGDTPFFAYVPYTAPHDPLQVPDAWLDRYDGVFDDGPEAVRAEVRQRLADLGLLTVDAAPPAEFNVPAWLPSHRKPWAERNSAERDNATRRMEIYAAMVELLDQQIGRLLKHLETTGQLDNTLVFFLSDNGASVGTPLTYLGNTREWVSSLFDLSVEQMGRQDSYTTMGIDWASVSNSPFRLFKGTMGEGGVRSPLLVAGPGVPQGVVERTPGQVMDLAMTLLDLAGADPASMPLYTGKQQPRGHSLRPIWAGEEPDPERMLISELFGNRMVRMGHWKAVYVSPPFGSGEWDLFDVVADPGSTRNRAAEHPELVARMSAAYDSFAAENGVIAPEGGRDLASGASWEGPCDWWCEARFGLVDTLVNPGQRNRALMIVVAVIGLALVVYLVRKRKAGVQIP